jgi:hypothetical protein
MRFLSLPVVIAGALAAAPAAASEEDFEFWLNPSIEAQLDGDTSVEFEAAQRLRDSAEGRPDTYYFRLWLKQDISEEFTLGGAVERRINDGGRDETRIMQQLAGSHGILKTRLRLEQRFVEGADRMGLRLRSRAGLEFPIGAGGKLTGGADAELFWVLRSPAVGGADGLTAVRATAGFEYEVSDRLTLGLAYLRQQDITRGGPDTVGHAPLVELSLSL